MRDTLIATAVLLAMAPAAAAERPVNETRPVVPDAEISIENIAGSVTVIGTDEAELVITGTLGDDVEELEIRGDAEEISVEVQIRDGDGRRGERRIAARLEVRVPRAARLDVETVSAPIDVSGVDGQIEAAAVSGDVTVTGGGSGVEAESVSGAVTVTGSAGGVTAESVSGRVVLAGVSGDLEASTVSGSVRVEAGAAEDVEIESVAGNVYFRGRLGAGDLEIESHSGNVEVHLPADVVAEVSLSTFSGRIENDFGPQARRTGRHQPGLRAEFSTGVGGVEVTVETFSGNIALRKF